MQTSQMSANKGKGSLKNGKRERKVTVFRDDVVPG
jgi:hypothetical protein